MVQPEPGRSAPATGRGRGHRARTAGLAGRNSRRRSGRRSQRRRLRGDGRDRAQRPDGARHHLRRGGARRGGSQRPERHRHRRHAAGTGRPTHVDEHPDADVARRSDERRHASPAADRRWPGQPPRCHTADPARRPPEHRPGGRLDARAPRTVRRMRVVITDPNLLPLRVELESLLPASTDAVWVAQDDALDALPNTDVLVGPAFTKAMSDAAPGLRLVQVAGAGTDRIQVDALTDKIVVANTYHHESSIAEYIVWALIALRRELPQADAALRQGRWLSPVYDATMPQPPSLESASVGFVGLGHIGRATWQVLRAFGARGQAVTGSGKADAEGLNWVGDTSQLPRLLEESDALVVSAPLT